MGRQQARDGVLAGVLLGLALLAALTFALSGNDPRLVVHLSNPRDTPVTATLVLTDLDGKEVCTDTVELPAGGAEAVPQVGRGAFHCGRLDQGEYLGQVGDGNETVRFTVRHDRGEFHAIDFRRDGTIAVDGPSAP